MLFRAGATRGLEILDYNLSWQRKFCTSWKLHRTAGPFPFLRPLSVLEVWLHNSLKKHSIVFMSLLRTVARLRSRIHWLKVGDANTRLFHSQAWHRKHKNFIVKLQSGNQAATSHEEKAQMLQKFYEGLIGTREQWDQTIDLEAVEIQQHDLHMLESPISEEEV
jgi:hypothetical protein